MSRVYGVARTTVSVERDTARRLHERKQYGESMDDVIRRLLGDDVEADETPDARTDELTPRVDVPDSLPEPVDESDAAAAIDAALRFVEDEPAQFATIAETVGRKYPLDYAVDQVELSDGAWWQRVVKPGLKQNGAEFYHGRGWTVS
jgi:hypothetical protein